MSSIRSEIGNLSTLFAFEAAGRLGSFTRAALELGVTQAAISKQIGLLEDRMEQPLFLRMPREVVLTAAGRELLETTSISLNAIAKTMRDLRSVKHIPLTIALSIPMSQFWLMPRLPDFTQAHPDIPLRILSQDDLNGAQDADIIIQFYGGPTPPLGAMHMFDGEVAAMASPTFLTKHAIITPGDVLNAPLIHYDTPDRNWISWREWASASNLPVTRAIPALSLNRYQDALIAAARNQGAVLAWYLRGKPLIPDGALVPAPGPRIPAPGAFYLTVLRPDRAGAQTVANWLGEAASASE